MGSFERFKTKTHFNSLKRLVGVTALAALAVKLLTVALATAAGGGTPLDLLARVPASLADLGAALLVFEVLRTRRPLQLAAAPSGVAGPGGLGPGWVLARSVDQGLAGWLAGAGRPLVLAAAMLPAVVWVRRRRGGDGRGPCPLPARRRLRPAGRAREPLQAVCQRAELVPGARACRALPCVLAARAAPAPPEGRS